MGKSLTPTGFTSRVHERSFSKGLRMVGVTLALAGVGVFTAACGTSEAPAPTPTVSEAPTPTKAPENPELIFEKKVEAYKIPDGLSSEELAEAILDRLTIWSNAGANEELESLPRDNHY